MRAKGRGQPKHLSSSGAEDRQGWGWTWGSLDFPTVSLCAQNWPESWGDWACLLSDGIAEEAKMLPGGESPPRGMTWRGLACAMGYPP